ncbi:GIY-YIG nuclease family protein [Thiohalobacter sp. IOR34]|uniref:GIY-YIG nuclease family protein n=1 Tax=Thiohalobacter sp. IOR34 TaxID=3057176 RepID=UPI0025B0E2FD|nr:GIY-YIG nuclease family protein [Thiohalobacter sp. IOR34]WJW75426.1 GIY-YIG nuclease family protein [Thiohalobacter sp. IOR34]
MYILLCSDGSLYTGISNDVARRLEAHRKGRGAKYFRGRRPQRLLFVEAGHSRSSASSREMEIKKLRREDKLRLIEKGRG